MWFQNFLVNFAYNTFKFFLNFVNRLDFYKNKYIFPVRGYSVMKIHNSTCSVEYIHDGEKYKIVFPKRRCVRKISKVIHSDEDVTEKFMKILGPFQDFHGISTTPGMLGMEPNIKIYKIGESNPEIFIQNSKITI